jgi:hypothetical protein
VNPAGAFDPLADHSAPAFEFRTLTAKPMQLVKKANQS